MDAPKDYDPFPGGMENATLDCWTPINSPEPDQESEMVPVKLIPSSEETAPILRPEELVDTQIIQLDTQTVNAATSPVAVSSDEAPDSAIIKPAATGSRVKLSQDAKAAILKTLELLILSITDLIIIHGPLSAEVVGKLETLYSAVWKYVIQCAFTYHYYYYS